MYYVLLLIRYMYNNYLPYKYLHPTLDSRMLSANKFKNLTFMVYFYGVIIFKLFS